MKKVSAYVKRHVGQGPSGDVEHSECRYSLIIFSNATNQANSLTATRGEEPEIDLTLV